MGGSDGYSRPGIAGSGAIACGLAACASRTGTVHLLARSDVSAWRAEEGAQTEAKKVDGAAPDRIRVTTRAADLAECDVIVESIVEDAEAKTQLLRTVAAAAGDADLATTTSSLHIGELAGAAGIAERFFGLHVFNPVTRMELVEVCLPDVLRDGIRERALAWCAAMDKTAIEVPDQVGFVVNRLLFPYLFEAVRLKEETGMSAEDVDTCMQLGAGHPMGPLKLLDFVGLDVAAAIGESLETDGAGGGADHVPDLVRELVERGKLGRKSGEGFFEY